MTDHRVYSANPAVDLAAPASADYELTATVDFDFQNYRGGRGGDWLSPVYGHYRLEAGRKGGRWRLAVVPVTGKDDEGFLTTAPPVLDLRDQTGGADPLALLRALLSGGTAGGGNEASPPAGSAVINGIRCDPATAERVYESPAGENCFVGDGFRRFDEVLYRTPDGYWFLVRPLAPDEAREWLWAPDHDQILAEQLFPEEEQTD